MAPRRGARRATTLRRLLSLFAFAGGLFALAALFRRGTARRRQRVDLYYHDGSMISLGEGSPEAGRLLELAREALTTART